MSGLKELRNRITSVSSTQKITRAMQMIAATKLRKAKEGVESARPFSDKLADILRNLTKSFFRQDNAPPLLVGTGKDDTHLFIIASSERGLCGGFNSSIVKLAKNDALELIGKGKEVKFITVGKKGKEILNREFGDKIIMSYIFSDIKTVGFNQADEVALKVLELFKNKEFDKCRIYYAKFASVLSQVPTALGLIPLDVDSSENIRDNNDCYEYEPDEEEILNDLLPRNLSVQIFRALLENVASEQGARLTAMNNATRNADEMIDQLTITYNRSRQATITSELIEIISGAEAL